MCLPAVSYKWFIAIHMQQIKAKCDAHALYILTIIKLTKEGLFQEISLHDGRSLLQKSLRIKYPVQYQQTN
jgi:hypothetical protein